ncbi:hypothetical protein Tco_1539270 [Tanacetum coccineum]
MEVVMKKERMSAALRAGTSSRKDEVYDCGYQKGKYVWTCRASRKDGACDRRQAMTLLDKRATIKEPHITLKSERYTLIFELKNLLIRAIYPLQVEPGTIRGDLTVQTQRYAREPEVIEAGNEKVPSELKRVIMHGHTDKKLTQAQLAQVINHGELKRVIMHGHTDKKLTQAQLAQTISTTEEVFLADEFPTVHVVEPSPIIITPSSITAPMPDLLDLSLSGEDNSVIVPIDQPASPIGQEGSLSLPDPSPGPSGSENWDSSFEIDVLLEEWPTTAGGESAETGTSVNRPESGRVPPATHVAPRGDEAGPSNQPPQGVPYPYHPEQVIGGDSVLSIERRLLSGQTTPSPLDIYLARIDAEDLFEAKVKILQRMAELDPTGDWERRGARALDNPRTATGEESLERRLSLFSDLDQGGRGSEAFVKLRGKVFRRETPPSEGSGT